MVLSIAIFILTLLTLVLVHEFGHFLVAKRFGIKVEEFGFGIPPRVWGKRIGETLYSLNLLPLGGFVKLLGEDEEGKPRSSRDFRERSVGQRIIVVLAGVIMNLFLAWIIFYSVIIYQNFRIIYPTPEPGVYVSRLEQNFPAEKAGIRIGDNILKVGDTSVNNFETARNLIKSKNGGEVKLTIQDLGGSTKQITITPKSVDNGDYLIGVVFTPIAIKEYTNLQDKIFSGITYSYDLTKLTFIGFGKLLTNLTSGNFHEASQTVSGPVGIASMSNDILSGGKQAIPFYGWFVGVISLTLAIFNVLPIPALDGGRLLFLVIETITRKKVREDIERMVHQIGFAILLTLALVVTYSDISKLHH